MMRLKNKGPDAEALAIDALGFLAEDMERLGRFLALTGIDPARLREAAANPGFLASVLDYLGQDESLLLAFSADRQLRPEWIATAQRQLAGAAPGPGDFC
ncbi:MAG: DUF3572 domain-containing protein [Beijerinckiaceae bacterium]|nr:DUF3572 domain-containing protein [Beijerinckiaceae bacterium]